MTKLKFVSVSALVTAAIVAWLFWVQRQGTIRLQAENQDLRQRSAQSEALRQENQRLREESGTEAKPPADNRELLRLRGQVGVLQRTASESLRQQAEIGELTQKLQQAEAQRGGEQEKNPEMRLLTSKVLLSTAWGHAVLKFAQQNAGRMPATLAAAAPYLSDNDLLPSNWRDTEQIVAQARTNGVSVEDFELVYHGSITAVEDPSRIIVLREKQPFHAADGRWSRIYVYGNGMGSTLWTDDGDFTAVEKGRAPK